jgi:hypothetical protein
VRRTISIAVVVVCVVAGGTVSCSSDATDDGEGEEAEIEVTGAVTGNITARQRSGVTGPSVDIDGAEAITPVVEVSTDGEVSGEVEIRIPALDVPTEAHTVFALGAEQRDGSWELLPARVEGDVVVVSTTHFSFFQGFMTLTRSVVDVARDAFAGLTSGVVAEAEPPSCEDEDGARSGGYEISSDTKDTVFWCFGSDDGGRFLRVVNNRRYALILSFGDGLTVTHESSAGTVEWVSRALTLVDQVAVAPREWVDFRVELMSGGSTSVTAEFDGVATSLAQLHMGASTAVTLLTRFGTTRSRSLPEILDLLLSLPDCAAATAEGNVGAMVASCFADLDTLRTAFGPGAAVVLAPLVFAGSLVEYFHSQLNALGDLFSDRDSYWITVTNNGGLPVMIDDRLGPLVVGMTVDEALATDWLGEESGTCSEALGIDTTTDERTFGIEGPSAPTGLRGAVDFTDGSLSEIRASAGVRVAGAFDVGDDLTIPGAADVLRGAGYEVETLSTFEPSDYLNATDADGDTLSVFYERGMAAGIPQFTTCD